MREKLVALAHDEGIALKQTYAKEGRYLRHKAGRYGHARQFKRMRWVIRRQRTIVGRLQRQIQTRVTTLTSSIRGLYAVSCGTRHAYLTAAAALNG